MRLMTWRALFISPYPMSSLHVVSASQLPLHALIKTPLHIGPDTYCLPRHHPHFRPSFCKFVVSNDVTSIIWQSLPARDHRRGVIRVSGGRWLGKLRLLWLGSTSAIRGKLLPEPRV